MGSGARFLQAECPTNSTKEMKGSKISILIYCSVLVINHIGTYVVLKTLMIPQGLMKLTSHSLLLHGKYKDLWNSPFHLFHCILYQWINITKPNVVFVWCYNI